MEPDIVQLETGVDSLGEGPLWDPVDGVFYWVDSLGARVRRLDPRTGETRSWPVPDLIGSLALRQDGGAVIALRTGFHWLDFEDGRVTSIGDPEAAEPRTRFNDGKVDRRGRFLAGTMAMDTRTEGLGSLYRLNPDLTVDVLERDVIVSNGPCFSPDGSTFYFADSPRATIWAWDYDQDSGALANKRVFVDVAATVGSRPEGATVDREGNLWSALVGSGQVGCFGPDGTVRRIIAVPAQRPSSVMFGGPDLDVIYMTSIRDYRGTRSERPEDGGLFAIRGTGARGLAEPRFAG
jgi:L-arabinonolactonase